MQKYKVLGDFMKKFIKSFVIVLLACTCLLAGCGKQPLKDNPATDAVVIGNGGYAVQKGDYLYYVNGYLDNYSDALKNDPSLNKKENAVLGAIYRTKLVNGKVEHDDNGFVKTTERVVPYVVGFENGGFYILGDYIYYVSPHMNQDGGGTLRTDYTNFYRINVNGLENERLYVSKSTSVADWKVYNVNGKPYLVIVEKVTDDKGVTSTNIVSVNAVNGKAKPLVNGVDTAVLNNDINLTVNENVKYNKYVYYTITDDDGQNKLGKVDFVTGNKSEYTLQTGATYSIKDLKNDSLYMTINFDGFDCLYRIDLKSNENLTNAERVKLTLSSYANYYIIEGVLNNIIAVDSNNIMYYLKSGNTDKVILTSSVTVVGLSDDCVYYIEGSELKRVNYVLSDAEPEKLGSGSKTYLLSLGSQVDINGSKIFVFAQYAAGNADDNAEGTKNYYLNYIDLYGNKQQSTFVGKFAEGHTPKEPTAEEKENGKVWVE